MDFTPELEPEPGALALIRDPPAGFSIAPRGLAGEARAAAEKAQRTRS